MAYAVVTPIALRTTELPTTLITTLPFVIVVPAVTPVAFVGTTTHATLSAVLF